MASCTLFGHKNCPDLVNCSLQKMITKLITSQSVDIVMYDCNAEQKYKKEYIGILQKRYILNAQCLTTHSKYAIMGKEMVY